MPTDSKPIGRIVLMSTLAIAGLILPSLIVRYWPSNDWAAAAETALNQSMENKAWVEPWQPINQKAFSSGWVRCGSLEDAVELDRKVDDGVLHEGKLVLSEGGMAWLGN